MKKREMYRELIAEMKMSDLLRCYAERAQYDSTFVCMMMEEFGKRNVDPKRVLEEERYRQEEIRGEMDARSLQELADILNHPSRYRQLSREYRSEAVRAFESKVNERLQAGEDMEAFLRAFAKRQRQLQRWQRDAVQIGGFGTKFFGRAGKREDGSFLTTRWVTAWGGPLFPLWTNRIKIRSEEEPLSSLLGFKFQEFVVIDGGRPHVWQVMKTVLVYWGPLLVVAAFLFW